MKILDKYLVPDWRDSWRFASVLGTTAVGTVGAVVAGYPDLILMLSQLLVSSTGWQAAIVGVTVLIIALRLWNQEADDANEE